MTFIRLITVQLFLILLAGQLNTALYAQENPLIDIQNEYESGSITVEEAYSQQLELITNIHSLNDHIKCATPLYLFEEQNRDKLTGIIQQSAYQNNAATQFHFSPSGKFRIRYEDSGTDSVPLEDLNNNGVPDYVDAVALSADESYQFMIEQVGFTDPIAPGSYYNIEITDQAGIYGFTSVRSDIGADTYISIDNDYFGYPSNSLEDQSIGSMLVTVAHELKHASQYAANRWQRPSGSVSWAEMDATLMEEVVYDDVNDYYNYIKTSFNGDQPNSRSIFSSPGSPVPGSYNYITWMLYFTENYGIDLLQGVWDQIETTGTLGIVEGLSNDLPDVGTTFQEAFTQNHLWHYYSNYRVSDPTYGFDEKLSYPIANVSSTLFEVPDQTLNLGNLSPLSARYLEIQPSSDDEGIIDIGINFNETQVGLGLILYLRSGGIEEVIRTGSNKEQLYFGSETTWDEISSLGIVITNYDEVISTGALTVQIGKNGNRFRITDPDVISIPEEFVILQNYPNPFNPTTNIEFGLPEPSYVKLDIYTITGQFVQNIQNGNLRAGTFVREFDATGLASGIYLYRLQINNRAYIRKMSYIR